MGYNLDAIKAALGKSKQGASGNTVAGSRLPYWKPEFGEHEIRFLPLDTSTGEPFLEVLYYTNLADNQRFVAPSMYRMPDPIKEQFDVLRKTTEGWTIAKHLRPKERYYAVILVRGKEDKGPQIWEFSKDTRNDIYGVLTHKDNVDEDMLSPDIGYDFTIEVSQVIEGGKVRTFKKVPVKQISSIQARKKPSPLSADPAQAKKWLESVPDLESVMKGQVKSPEELMEALDNFLATLGGSSAAPVSTQQDDDTEQDSAVTTKPQAAKKPSKAEAKLASVFGALDS